MSIITPGKNRGTVTREKRNPNDEVNLAAKDLVRQAGQLVRPWNGEYLGSATVHYYGVPTVTGQPEFIVICHSSGHDVIAEGLADKGWKELQTHLMTAYGRKIPTRRKA